MKLKPENNSNELLGMTRAEAKMYEYDVPEDNRIRINKEKIKDLFILTIALLGDYSAKFYNDINENDSLKELKDNLVFSAQFFDAYLNAKLQDENRDYYIIMGSAAYYLCDYMGSAKVLSNKLKLNKLNLDVNKLDLLLLSFLKNDFSTEIQESVYIEFINNIISSWNLFCSNGEYSENIFQNLNNLKKEIYKSGTDRELLFVDILCAVVKKKYLHTTWYTMPLFTDIDKETWKPILTKIGIKELWPSQILIGKNEIFKGKSATIQMPTSAGKTKAAELIIRSAFLVNRTNLAVIVAPFRALCHDIQDDMQKAFYGENIEIDELSDVYQVDYEFEDSKEQRKILILTPEKLLYTLRQTPELAHDIGLIIYDEGHQFDSTSRGTNYELLLTSLKLMLPKNCQTILISAVMGNMIDVNDWLNGDNSIVIDGKNIVSTYRTIAFTSWLETKGKIQFINQANPEIEEYYVPRIIETVHLDKINDVTESIDFPKKNDTSSISLYLGLRIISQGSVAIFCGQRKSIKKFCEQVNVLKRQYNFNNIINCSDSNEISKIYNLYMANLGESSYTSTAKIGILTHHRTIPQGIRLSIEYAMKESLAKFVICTSTLAQGVNMPLRYLIINSTQQGADSILVRDFQNLIGRAGRAGMYTEGSIIFANNLLYDSRRNSKERWRWKRIKELIDPHNSENCNSTIFKIFDPIKNGLTGKNSRYITMKPLDFAKAYINSKIEQLIETIMQHETIMENNQDICFKREELEYQCNEKINIIKNIESFILAQVDFQDNYEEEIKELAESTLAYHLGDQKQKEEIIELFKLLGKHILESTQDNAQRKYFAKTLYGINENIELQNWIEENSQKLKSTEDIDLFLELIFEKLTQYTNSKFYNQCNQQSEVKNIIKMWLNGDPYYKILENLIEKSIKRETKERTFEYQIDDIVEFCENTLAYDGSLFISAIIELLPNIYCGLDITNIIENLKLIQKRFKYGLSSKLEIILYELGFNDRTIVQELSIYLNNIPERSLKKHIIKKYLHDNKEVLRPVFTTFPSYFAEKMENI